MRAVLGGIKALTSAGAQSSAPSGGAVDVHPRVQMIEKLTRQRAQKAFMFQNFRKKAAMQGPAPPPPTAGRQFVRPSPRSTKLVAQPNPTRTSSLNPPQGYAGMSSLFTQCQKRRLAGQR